jgi:hypothetical protein
MRLRGSFQRLRRALQGFLRGFLGLSGPPPSDSSHRCC